MEISGAELFVSLLEELGVKYIFTIPGAAIDPILNILVDHGPKVIVCRHEQNAAFMAQAWGRVTGEPGICLVTAGPGATNCVTGIATANAERCPVIVITGQIPQRIKFKHSHQNLDTASLFRPISKWSIEIDYLETLPDILSNAFRIAQTPRLGAVHISIPSNILLEKTTLKHKVHRSQPILGIAPDDIVKTTAKIIDKASFPVMFIGGRASNKFCSTAIRSFLQKHKIPVVATFEATGILSRDLVHLFMGRLGLFKNQPGDKILDKADILLTVGYDPIEYDPVIWNKNPKRPIINIDTVPAILDQTFHPKFELIGDISKNILALKDKIQFITDISKSPEVKNVLKILVNRFRAGINITSTPVHPLRLIYEARQFLEDDVTVIVDVGSHQYWWAQHFLCFQPKYFLTSMGFQTMGCALPWAIATSLARPKKKIFSISGDGSFLMSSMELETAVRLQLPIVHMVWEDGSFNLVKIQQNKKYGRCSAVDFGYVDTVDYAKSFQMPAFRINSPSEIRPIFKKAFATKGPCVISVPIDYKDNQQIVETLSDY